MLNKILKTAIIPPRGTPATNAPQTTPKLVVPHPVKSSPRPQAKQTTVPTYKSDSKDITLEDMKTPQAILEWIWKKYDNANKINPANLEGILTKLKNEVKGLSLDNQFTLDSNVESLIKLTSPLKDNNKYENGPIIAVLYKTIKDQTQNATNNATQQNIQNGRNVSAPSASDSVISNVIQLNPNYYPSATQFLQSVGVPYNDRILNIKEYKYSRNPKQDAARIFGRATVPRTEQYQAWNLATGFTEAPLTTTPNANKREYLVWNGNSNQYNVFGSRQVKKGYEVNTNVKYTLEKLIQQPMFAKVKSLIDNMAISLSITRMVQFITALQSDISDINNKAGTHSDTFRVEQQVITKWCTEWYYALNDFRILLLKPGRNEI